MFIHRGETEVKAETENAIAVKKKKKEHPQCSLMCTYNYMRHYPLCRHAVVSIKYYNN